MHPVTQNISSIDGQMYVDQELSTHNVFHSMFQIVSFLLIHLFKHYFYKRYVALLALRITYDSAVIPKLKTFCLHFLGSD